MINTTFFLLALSTQSRLNMMSCVFLALIVTHVLWSLFPFPDINKYFSARISFISILAFFIFTNAYITAKYFSLPFGRLSAEYVLQIAPQVQITIPSFFLICAQIIRWVEREKLK